MVYGDDTNPMTYTYNLSGALVEQKYPSGRVVRNVLDNEGDLSMVQSKKNQNFGYHTYVSNFTYNASGAATSLQLGNGKWESTIFNSRLQPTQIALGTVQNGYDKLKLNYSYGDWNGGSIDATKNNGNIVQQVITVPTVGVHNGFTATQKYYYDSLNRIDDATEDISGQTWQQDFTYDRYGNRNFVEANTTTIPKNCGTAPNQTVCPADVPIFNPSANTGNNRLNGYTFDSSGNTTQDAQLRKFTYDGENKQVKVETVNSGGTVTGTVGHYVYDGDGKRVKKKGYTNNILTEETIFVYDAGGKLVAEYSNDVASVNDAKVAYLTSDHLGSPRINTDQNGAVAARHDYHPFGEEISTSHRIGGLGYADDTIRKQFTGYENDNESNLDYAINRYYNGRHGRFSSVDPYNIIFEKEKGEDKEKKQKIFVVYVSQPQIWNKFAYSFNNPLTYSDPDGRRPVTAEEERMIQKFIASGLAYANEITDPTERQNFINAVNNAADAIRNAILAVPNDAKEDPKNLRAVLYAMGWIGNPNNLSRWSSSGTARFNSQNANVQLGARQNKCTIFVGIAYAMGANIGWNNEGNTKGYQINWSWSGNAYTPVANDLVTSGATNFTAVSSPQLGDIAAGHGDLKSAGWFSNEYHQGHAGLAIYGNVVISANPDHGVRVGRFGPKNSSDSTFKYLRYKP